MVDKTTSFNRRAKGRRGTSRRTARKLLLKIKKPKSGPKPETKCFYCKGTGHWKRNCPKYLADKKDCKVEGIFDIHMCTLVMLIVAPGYLILVLLLIFATRNRGYGLSEDWLRTR